MAGIYNTSDIYMTDDGDWAPSVTGDLMVADPDEDIRQEVAICLYTPLGDFKAFPLIGSMFEQFIGEPNTATNGGLVRRETLRALTQYAGFSSSDLTVIVTPVAIDQILIRLAINNELGVGTQYMSVDFNYIKGPTIIRS